MYEDKISLVSRKLRWWHPIIWKGISRATDGVCHIPVAIWSIRNPEWKTDRVVSPETYISISSCLQKVGLMYKSNNIMTTLTTLFFGNEPKFSIPTLITGKKGNCTKTFEIRRKKQCQLKITKKTFRCYLISYYENPCHPHDHVAARSLVWDTRVPSCMEFWRSSQRSD